MRSLLLKNFVYSIPIVVCACMFGSICTIADNALKKPEKETTPIEQILQKMESSPGNTYGTIYTLDGKPMTEHSFLGIEKKKENGDEVVVKEDKSSSRSGLSKSIYQPTKEYYASVVGIKSDYSQGLLGRAKSILTMNTEECNRIQSLGNSITTTILEKPQEEAYKQLKDYFGLSSWCSIVVLNSDGAILVDVGSNSSAIQNYSDAIYDHYSSPISFYSKEPVPSERLSNYDDFGTESQKAIDKVGSSFKPITARILQLNNEALGDLAIDRDDAFDNGYYVLNDGKNTQEIRNADFEEYHYPARTSLADAMSRSSNSYFLERVERMGMSNYLNQLNHYFVLNSPLESDVHTIPAVPFDTSKVDFFYDKFCFGQEAQIVPVRLASLHQHALSGYFYTPFMIAQIRTPDDEVIYRATVREREESHFDVNMKDDIVVDSLRQTFFSYVRMGFKRSKAMKNEYPLTRTERSKLLSIRLGIDDEETIKKKIAEQEANELSQTMDAFPKAFLYSGRVLAKSGTAEKIKLKNEDNTLRKSIENHTMVVTVLDESQEHILYTGVLMVDNMQMLRSDSERLAAQDTMAVKLLHVMDQIDENGLYETGSQTASNNVQPVPTDAETESSDEESVSSDEETGGEESEAEQNESDDGEITR